MTTVLHITAHMGGGVGKVLSGIAVYAKQCGSDFQHKILLLEPPEKLQFVELCESYGVEVLISSDQSFIKQQICAADIIQLEWWHHPKMAWLLHSFPELPVRMVIWSHISGCNYPALPFELVNAPQQFLFTSHYSMENPLWDTQQKECVAENAIVVNSSGGFSNAGKVAAVQQKEFCIGYVGTLSYSKLHPDFIEYCAAVDVPEARFVLVGDSQNQGVIQEQARQRGMVERLEFPGYAVDVAREFARFDVFGYMLNPEHFGTTENVLLEAMAFGLPVVAFNQNAEKYLIEHMQTGILVNSVQEYAYYMRCLHEDPQLRIRLGENARNFVLKEFSVENTVSKLEHIYRGVMKKQRKVMSFDHIFGEKPYQWFLSCLGLEREHFEKSIAPKVMSNVAATLEVEDKIRNCRLILREKSKSSIYQFEKYYNDDKYLNYWLGLLTQENR